MTFDLWIWPWHWHNITQKLQLHEMGMHPKYEVSILTSWKVMIKDKLLEIWPLTLNYDLDLWPMCLNPAVCTSAFYREHLCHSILKSFQGLKRCGADTKIEAKNIWPWIVTLTFDPRAWIMRSAHRLVEVNICAKAFWNPSIDFKDMERTGKLRLKIFDLELWPWPLTHTPKSCLLHTVLLRWTFVPKHFEILP